MQKLFTSDRKFNELNLEMEKKDALHDQVLTRQTSVENDLKRELEVLKNRLASARTGSKAESEMYQETLEKFSQQERCISELEAKLCDLASENADLVVQLKQRRESVSSGDADSSFDHHHPVSKNTGSSSSGVSSDLSDSDNASDPGHQSPSQVSIMSPLI